MCIKAKQRDAISTDAATVSKTFSHDTFFSICVIDFDLYETSTFLHMILLLVTPRSQGLNTWINLGERAYKYLSHPMFYNSGRYWVFLASWMVKMTKDCIGHLFMLSIFLVLILVNTIVEINQLPYWWLYWALTDGFAFAVLNFL